MAFSFPGWFLLSSKPSGQDCPYALLLLPVSMSPVTNRRGGPCNSSTRFPRSPHFGLLRAFPALWPDRGVSRYPPMVALALFSAGKILMTIGRSFRSAYSRILFTITPWNFCMFVCLLCSLSKFSFLDLFRLHYVPGVQYYPPELLHKSINA